MDRPDSTSTGVDESLAGRVDSLATWVHEIEARLRAAEVATGDEKTAKELRKALEAFSKHDPKLEKRVTDHMTVVTQRFETLASTVSTTAAALAAREGEIAGLRRELEDAERRIEHLQSRSAGGADASELARLRGIVDALSAQRPARMSDSRVDELGAKVRMLAERVDSLTATVSANAAALGRRDSELGAIRERIDAGTQKIETFAVELRRLGRDDSLAARLDSLQVALVEANGAISDREAEAAQLRARIDEAYSRVGDVVEGLQRSVGELTTQVGSLSDLPRATASAVEQRASALDGRLDTLADRLDAIAADVGAGLAAIEQRDGQLAGLYRDVEAERTRVDALVAELREAIDGLPDPAAGNADIQSRLETLRDGVVAVTFRLQELEGSFADRSEAEHASAEELGRALGRLTDRLDTAERERESAAEQMRRADESWLEERDWVRRQLERLAEAQAETSRVAGDVTLALEEHRARLDGAESEREKLAHAVDRLSELVETGRDDVEGRLDALASAIAEAAGAEDGVAQQELTELVARLEEVERRSASAAAEAAREAAVWTSTLTSLEQRLAQASSAVPAEVSARLELTDRLLAGLASRIEAVERASAATAEPGLAERVDDLGAKLARVESAAQSAAAAAAVAAASSSSDEVGSVRDVVEELTRRVEAVEHANGANAPASSLAQGVDDVRALVEELRAQVTADRKELATLASARDAATRVDDLARRLDAVEHASAEGAALLLEVDEPGSGEGRFRLELRSLELRMEHAEAAARENREAVLTQLERLASRVEWRLQRLEEAAQAGSYSEPEETGAQVVPIRGGADTS